MPGSSDEGLTACPLMLVSFESSALFSAELLSSESCLLKGFGPSGEIVSMSTFSLMMERWRRADLTA